MLKLPESRKEFYASGKNYFKVTRPQRVCDSNQPTGFRLATLQDKLAKKDEELQGYNCFKSDGKSLDEFGLGVSLYFKTLKAFGLIFLVSALIGVIAMNENYEYQENYSGLLIPPDPDCSLSDPDHVDNNGEFNPPHVDTPTRLLGSVYGVTRMELEFASQGTADIILVGFLFCMVLLSAFLEKREVLRSDKNQQTMRDYTVMVVNPPTSITETKTYHEYFSKFGDIVLISVIPKNGSLLKDVANKIVMEKQLRCLISSDDGECSPAPAWIKNIIQLLRGRWLFRAVFPSQESLKEDISLLSERISTASTAGCFTPWRVFISFNTETDRENCLNGEVCHQVGGVNLVVKRSPEPNEIIYENSDSNVWLAYCRNMASYIISFCIIVITYIIIYYLNLVKGTAISIFVTAIIVVINAALPFLMKHLTFIVEIHHSREIVQQSILLKLLLSRCIVSAVIIYHVTPYDEKFSIKTLETIQDIVLADALVPILRAIDAYGYFSRYVLAPVLGLDQESFNIFWRGTEYNLAERYANTLKAVFTALFFAVPLPSGLFIGAFTLAANYISDKYLLMHKWKKMPPIGAGLGRLCRMMFMFILFIHCLISLHFFANWPYRGVCGGDKAKVPNCHLTCDVNQAMTPSQRKIVHIYNVFSVMGFVFMVIWVTKVCYTKYFSRYLNLSWKARKIIPESGTTVISSPSLRSIDNARAYVPTVKRNLLSHRLICADLSHIPAPYNYSVRNTAGDDEVQFEPLSVTKLDFSTDVLTNVIDMCAKISFYGESVRADLELEIIK